MSDPATVEALKRDFRAKLFCELGRFPAGATRNDLYLALAYAVRDRLLRRWVATSEAYFRRRVRTVCYLSAEFLMGPQLGNALVALGVEEEVRQAVRELGLDFDELLAQEEEPGLGNGGLGRLAACFMDSLATLEIPTLGYGIRYEFGILDQTIRGGSQFESTDKWLQLGNPWGYSTEVPCFNPADLVKNIKKMMNNEPLPSYFVDKETKQKKNPSNNTRSLLRHG